MTNVDRSPASLGERVAALENNQLHLATKADLLRTESQIMEKISAKIDAQTDLLTKEIKGVRDRQTKIIGTAVGAGFVLSLVIGAGNLAVNLDIIPPAPESKPSNAKKGQLCESPLRIITQFRATQGAPLR